MKNACKIYVKKLQSNRPLERSRNRLEDSIKTGHEKVGARIRIKLS
jgi:hypothetical protein